MAKGTTSILFRDASIASLSGASQQLLPFDAQRQYLRIDNVLTAARTITINLTGGTAIANSAGCITLAAGQFFEPQAGCIPTNAITVIGTAADPVTCTVA